ncbi:MAG: hypothetical protein D6677_13360 [Calditrichaeota bacterium]|nr:MAG: hypothetical protein D6677_13360 [Calditrichota bacterium]
MRVVDIHEPIEVITHFGKNSVRPLRFKWNERVYKVRQWNSFWVRKKGYDRHYHFAVKLDNADRVVLSFDDSTLQWQIARIYLDE